MVTALEKGWFILAYLLCWVGYNQGNEVEMDDKKVQIREYTGPGYQPVVAYDAWRVAIMHNADAIEPERLQQVERHLETDEVFVLLGGKCVLIIGLGDGRSVGELEALPMEPQKVYNIRRGVWHTAIMSGDASVLIIENADTAASNSEFAPLSSQQREWLRSISAE